MGVISLLSEQGAGKRVREWGRGREGITHRNRAVEPNLGGSLFKLGVGCKHEVGLGLILRVRGGRASFLTFVCCSWMWMRSMMVWNVRMRTRDRKRQNPVR